MCYCEYYFNCSHHSLSHGRKAANSVSLLSPYKSCSSLFLWNDSPKIIRVFSLAQSNSLFLLYFSSSVLLFLLIDMGIGEAFFSSVAVVCSPPLFTVWVWMYLTREEQALCLYGRGALPSMCCMREVGCQQCMHENDWHFSDTHLGSDWLYWAGSGGFLQVKLGPLAGPIDSGFLHSWPISYSPVRSMTIDDKIVTEYSYKEIHYLQKRMDKGQRTMFFGLATGNDSV